MIKVQLIKNKIIERYRQFVIHPLVKNSLIGLIKYLYLNSIIRLYPKPIKIKWLNDLRYYITLGDSGIIGNYYFFIDDYEESIFLIHYLTSNDLFVDVGANHGHYTMISSGICKSKSIAIEPVSETFERLKMNIELNKLKNVKLFNLGISDAKGQLYISNNLGSMNRVIDDSKKHNNCELIKVTTLDKLLSEEKKINLLKIDVEGFEKQVLLGCKEILKNPFLNVIIIELNNSNKHYNYNENDTIVILEKSGFYPYKYIHPDNKLVLLEKKNFDSYNTIFIRNIDYVKERIKKKSIKIYNNRIRMN